jgi:tetratricopeptide (TPR) repeat protein
MASIVPGYEYDIFISYRQKDNKYDGWVTEFVDNLKRELEATFKEDISIYFDENPLDGLLEIHDVDASLKEKLKCLVFIPIISRTYCDPKSFAWTHEFKAFVEQVTNDQFGLKVKLLNGNVARRVLPVRIHDLDYDDLRLCEGILDGVLRSVDFIYKSPGVNRPLRANEDHPQDNLNKIYYRDQINKLANAIDEIISSLKRIQNSSQNENWSFKEPGAQNNIDVFNNDDSPKTIDIQLQLQTLEPGQKKIPGIIQKFKGYAFKPFNKYVFSILFTALMVVLIFSWKGQLNFFGPGKSKRELAKSHVANAKKYFDNKEYEAAKSELELALSSDPEYSYAWSTLAAVSVNQGNLNKAIGETIKAVKLDRTNSQAAYNMAYALEDKKDYHQAIIWYKEAIKIDSTLKKDSTIVPAYSALGRLYNSINQPIDAIIILNTAKDSYPESKYIYLIYKNLGNAFLLQDQLDEAIKYLELSREIKQDEPETNLYLARAYEASGKMTRSIEQWQNYIESETDTLKISEAKKHLKEITIKHLKEIIQ